MRAKVWAGAAATILLVAGAGCTSPQPTGDPLGDPPPGLGIGVLGGGAGGGPTDDGGGAGGAVGSSTCDMYAQLADASSGPVVPSEAGAAGDGGDAAPDAFTGSDGGAFVSPTCVPLGAYNSSMVVNMGDCTKKLSDFPPTQSDMLMIAPAQGPFPTTYPTYVDCDPPVAPFTEGNCNTFVPPGTVCKTQSYTITYTSCGFLTCTPDGNTCTFFTEGTLSQGGVDCHISQTVKLKR